MNTDLSAYVKLYKSMIPEELCDDTVQALQEANWAPELFYNNKINGLVEPKESLDVTSDLLPTTNMLTPIIWNALKRYILEDFNFPWHPGWAGFSMPKYNRYSITNGMALHCDHIHSLFEGERKGIPILTVLFLLNDDFEGGEFVMFKDTVIPLKKGDILVFPSIFLFPHKVTNITSGTRYSGVCWSW